jgi:hypothetical protein
VPLTEGKLEAGGIRSGYHGWLIAPDGRVRAVKGFDAAPDVEGPRAYAAREEAGLAWVFLGEPGHASMSPPPGIFPYGGKSAASGRFELAVDAHWTLLLDAGLDLVHRRPTGLWPLGFEIKDLGTVRPDADLFRATYDAHLSLPLARARRGALHLKLERSRWVLELGEGAKVQAWATPRSADGRKLTVYWLVSFPARGVRRLLLQALMPMFLARLSAALKEELSKLSAEQAALDGWPDRPALESNPVVGAAHAHLEKLISRYAKEAVGQGRAPELVEVSRTELLAQALAGEVAVLAATPAEVSLLTPRELEALVPEKRTLPVYRYRHFALVER